MLSDINLDIKDKEIFALLGETGAGKTVLLESIAGFYDFSYGDISYDGISVKDIPLAKRQIGFVYQNFSLFPHMTVKNNIEFGLRMHKVPVRKRHEISNDIMVKLNIEHLVDRYPQNLSGGEKQRVALARAIVLKPNVLFMDEPFSAIDPTTRKQMYNIIREIHSIYNCTIVFVTHNFKEALALADRIGILIGGKLKKVCKSSELFSNNKDDEVIRFLGREDTIG